jgi:hypothetical protein
MKRTDISTKGSLSFHLLSSLMLCALILVQTSCAPPSSVQSNFSITLQVDTTTLTLEMPSGSTVQDALLKSGITLSTLDRVTPPSYTLLSDNSQIKVIRVREEFEVEEKTIPFTKIVVKNENLPLGQPKLVQAGANGTRQITYKITYEDNIEVERVEFDRAILKEAKSEIQMVGIVSPFTSLPITGQIAYLTAGNAWVMKSNTGERQPTVTTGDLDGNVFSISPDGNWLLFTRKSEKDPAVEINTLWVVNLNTTDAEPFPLNAKNIVLYADWVPGEPLTVTYSTVEPRSVAPFWQANNDLFLVSFTEQGKVSDNEEIIPSNSGEIYGWGGTTFAWSPDGAQLAFSRPSSWGLVDLQNQSFIPLFNLNPFLKSDGSAWVPGISWSPDQQTLFSVSHLSQGGSSASETSPDFNVTATLLYSKQSIDLVSQSGIYSHPSPSPFKSNRYYVAFMQADTPKQSEFSHYRLMVMDQDGSNARVIFPEEGSIGLDSQKVVWSPESIDAFWGVALIYEGNLWLVNLDTGALSKITGDGSISKIDWK